MADTVTLTTPCTLNELVEFIEHVVKPLHEGVEADDAGTVTTTTTTLAVS